MKEFFENPALLFGVPLLALGCLGVGIAVLTALAPQRPAATAGGLMLPSGSHHSAHPGPIGTKPGITRTLSGAGRFIVISRMVGDPDTCP